MKSLQVEEGSEGVITSDNIKVLLDLKKLGISLTQVLFHIIEQPRHGVLSEIKQRKVFSLDQLTSNKIRYSHDGSESVSDNFVFEIEIDSEKTSILSPELSVRQAQC